MAICNQCGTHSEGRAFCASCGASIASIGGVGGSNAAARRSPKHPSPLMWRVFWPTSLASSLGSFFCY